MTFDILQTFFMGLLAFLYASVGHGGASGYLALMAIYGVAPPMMKSSALILNVFVSLIAFVQYYRAGYFKWNLFWPFAVTSIPMSFIGATLPITDSMYKKLLAVALMIAIGRMLLQALEKKEIKPNSIALSLLVGAVIGLLSGMLSIGGGIILSPVILLLGWGRVKES